MTVFNMKESPSDAGLDEIRMMSAMIREHYAQARDLLRRRKQLVLRLRKQDVTYKKLANAMGVSEQTIYKIVKDDIVREPQLDEFGNPIRRRGRPPKPAA
jgi:DNA-directed RNA polymerase specialized sigma subunit